MNGRYLCRGIPILMMTGVVLFGPGPLHGQTSGPLVSGKVVEGSTDWDGPASFEFDTESAGVLTIVVRAADEADLFLLVTDLDGQPIPGGRSDQDLGGVAGAEQFAVSLPRKGRYLVHVNTYSESRAAFKVGVSWLPFPDLGVPADPDGSPSEAIPIRIGQDTRADSLDGTQGDFWDWYYLKAEKGGTLTVATRADEGDIVLEAFSPGEFAEALERSDQDLQANGGNEALTLVVEAGEEFFFRVSAFSEGSVIPYRLQVGFIPN